jgi:hypothetical protein
MLWLIPSTYNIFSRQSYVSMLVIGGRDPHFGRGFLFVLAGAGNQFLRVLSGCVMAIGNWELMYLGKYRDKASARPALPAYCTTSTSTSLFPSTSKFPRQLPRTCSALSTAYSMQSSGCLLFLLSQDFPTSPPYSTY